MIFKRTDTSPLARWWRTIDKINLAFILSLIFTGILLINAAGPPAASRIRGISSDQIFVVRHIIFMIMSLVIIWLTSMLSIRHIKLLAVVGYVVCLILLFLLPVIGTSVKGATRWIYIGFSLQPSEFMKPFLIILTAWMFAERYNSQNFPGYIAGSAMFILVVGLLIIQPDVGMTLLVTAVFVAQLAISGVSYIVLAIAFVVGVVAIFMIYNLMPHAQKRIDTFLDPSSGDYYQVGKAIEAFSSGGGFGRGLGEGVVKWSIPDSHTDFIFAVAGEEFGLFGITIIVFLYIAIILRGIYKTGQSNNLFILIASTGLITQFGLQAFINMGVAVGLLPAKGMTLPFISYGGSSTIAMAITMGMLLALTRKQYNNTGWSRNNMRLRQREFSR